jgi:hypothetical protein
MYPLDEGAPMTVNEPTTTLTVTHDPDAVIAMLRVGQFTFTGSARRAPGDEPDWRIGENLAVSRALAKAATKLRKRAEGMERQAQSIRDHKRVIAEKQKKANGQTLHDTLENLAWRFCRLTN